MYEKYKKLMFVSCFISNVFSDSDSDFDTFLKDIAADKRLYVRKSSSIKNNYYVGVYYDELSGEQTYVDHEEACNVRGGINCSCRNEKHDIHCCFETCSKLCKSESNKLLKLSLLQEKYKESYQGLICKELRIKLFNEFFDRQIKEYCKDGSIKVEDTPFTNPLMMQLLKNNYNNNLTQDEKNSLHVCCEQYLQFYNELNEKL